MGLLVSLPPAVAADESSIVPTVEEILSDYHEKAFEAEMQSEAGAYSARSHGGSAKSLEQETVDILTDAGYEAYNVTADNFATMERNLNTDFDSMGMNPNGNYIIVISGDDAYAAVNPNTRSGSAPGYESGSGNEGASQFEYTYNGQVVMTHLEDF